MVAGAKANVGLVANYHYVGPTRREEYFVAELDGVTDRLRWAHGDDLRLAL